MTDEQINEVMRLVRDAVVTNSLFATGQIADMSIVGEAKYALEAYLRTIGEPESVNAEMLEALKDARHCIGIDRDTLVDCHTNPCTGYLDPDGALDKTEYDDVIDAADAAIARAESAIESSPKPVSPDLLESARAVVARWDAPTWKDFPATAEYIGRLRAAIAQADLDGALTAEEWVVKNVSGSPGLVRAMVIRAEAEESAIETPAKVSPCAGHAVQQDADAAIGLAQALEQHRARKIVDAVSALPVGGKHEESPSPFHAGYQLACDEVMHRLLTEEWDGCLTPPGKQEDDEAGGA